MADDNNNTLTVVPVTQTNRKGKGSSDRDKEKLLDLIRSDPNIPDDYNPVVEMAKLAFSQRLPINLRMKAHMEVAAYVTPKIKPVDPTDGEKTKAPVLELVRVTRTAEEQKALDDDSE